jgi:uncharacterized Rmd1/YagE family protein
MVLLLSFLFVIIRFLELETCDAFLFHPFTSVAHNTPISRQISVSKWKEARLFAGTAVFSQAKLTVPSRRLSKRMQTKSKSISTSRGSKKDSRSRAKETLKPSSLASASGDDRLQKAGRVSVYCVGSSIDLEGLRGYIFRKSFGNEGKSSLAPASDKNEESSTSVTRAHFTRASISDYDKDPDIDDEDVFHVTNAPLIISPLINEKKIDDASLSSLSTGASSSSLVLPASVSTMDWKTKEVLLMSLQDIFYFGYGCVVFWGLTKNEEKIALNELLPFVNEPVTAVELEDSHDDDEFCLERPLDVIGDGRTEVEENHQSGMEGETGEDREGTLRGGSASGSTSGGVSSGNPNWSFDGIKLTSLARVEKLTYSYALAQSSKLFVLESKVDESIEGTRSLPKELAETGKISSYKKNELNKLIGQLFVEQTEVNLFSSILDTPEFLWEHDSYFPIYANSRKYLDIDHRVELLNDRLTVTKELLVLLTSQVASNRSHRLEWSMIWLIVIEIGIGLSSNPFFLSYVFKNSPYLKKISPYF